VNKALERQTKNNAQPATADTSIFIKHNSALMKLTCSDILWIEAMENYVVINTSHEKYTVLFTMSAIEKKLPQNRFIRVHKSFIINIDEIRSFEDKTIKILSKDTAVSIPVGRTYRDRLVNELKKYTVRK
jgi:DNA-binding LytR/AlgR family response regulator